MFAEPPSGGFLTAYSTASWASGSLYSTCSTVGATRVSGNREREDFSSSAPSPPAPHLLAHGRLQREGLVVHVLVSRLENLSARMEELTSQSRDFC
jgi:hypothetical protein